MLRYIYRISWAINLGSMVFFAAILAPRVFQVLSRQDASNLQEALFPPYFTLGVICSAIMLALLYFIKKMNFKALRAAALGFSLLALLYARNSIVPEMNSLRPAALLEPKGSTATPESARFQELHKLSVRLNGAVLILFLFL